jgi:hypothetical protein
MKNHSLLLTLGIAFLLVASLFSYSRTETIEHATTRLSVDGAAFAMLVLCIALFVVCRRIRGVVRSGLRRAGLPQDITIPSACRYVILAAIPFSLLGYSSSTIEGSVTRSFGFGMSPFKLSAFALVVLVVWLITLLQRLRELTDHLQANSNATGSV